MLCKLLYIQSIYSMSSFKTNMHHISFRHIVLTICSLSMCLAAHVILPYMEKKSRISCFCNRHYCCHKYRQTCVNSHLHQPLVCFATNQQSYNLNMVWTVPYSVCKYSVTTLLTKWYGLDWQGNKPFLDTYQDKGSS